MKKWYQIKKIKILLNTDFVEIKNKYQMIPQLCMQGQQMNITGISSGKLKYKSLKFVFETFRQEEYQPAPVVNYQMIMILQNYRI